VTQISLDIFNRANPATATIVNPVFARHETFHPRFGWIKEILANAWYPHTYFKLSFGLQDKISDKLDFLNLEISEIDIFPGLKARGF
jgi:hypothetical protein